MGALDKRQAGAPSPAFSAAWVNAVSESAAYYQSQVAAGDASRFRSPLQVSSGIVSVRNDSGGDLIKGRCLQLRSYVCDYSAGGGERVNAAGLVFSGNTYSDAANGRVAILAAAIKAGEIGNARVLGVCVARVNVTNASHRFATAANNSNVLASATSGAIEILSDVTATGEQDVVVVIGGGGGGGTGTQKARVTTGITAATNATTWGSGYVKLQDPDTGTLDTATTAVDNEWIEHAWVVDAQVCLDMAYDPPRVITGTCEAVTW